MKRIFGLAILLGACHGGEAWTPVATRDTKDDPAKVRAGYGNADLHVWFPVAETEIAALKQVDAAGKGDAHALLDLALVASGTNREVARFSQYRQRVDAFLTELKPTIDAADDWHKGFELNKAMRRVFFKGEDHGGYQLGAGRLVDVFETGHFNCLSSSLLYIVLARGFGVTVRGVLLPEHAFVEYATPSGKILEVETTSSTGFDWIHDERYYKEGAEDKFAKSLGLMPLTLADYEKREIVDPVPFIARAMNDKSSGTDEHDRQRLSELSAILDPTVDMAAGNATVAWKNDAIDLADAKSWNTIVKLFDTVGPSIANISNRSKSTKALMNIGWLRVQYAEALVNVRRADDAIVIMDEGLKTLDPKWPDVDKIRSGLLYVLIDQLTDLMRDKKYDAALALIKPRFETCRSDQKCADNLGIVYRNQAVDQWNSGDKKAALHTLDECVKLVPLAKECKSEYDDWSAR